MPWYSPDHQFFFQTLSLFSDIFLQYRAWRVRQAALCITCYVCTWRKSSPRGDSQLHCLLAAHVAQGGWRMCSAHQRLHIVCQRYNYPPLLQSVGKRNVGSDLITMWYRKTCIWYGPFNPRYFPDLLMYQRAMKDNPVSQKSSRPFLEVIEITVNRTLFNLITSPTNQFAEYV